MANWLGGNWTSQLDQLKKQVTDFTKDVLVAGEEEDEDTNREALQFPRQQIPQSEEERLRAECHKLEQLRQEAVRDKEEKCGQFRQLLLDKEEEISTLEQMVSGDSTASVSASDGLISSIGKMLNAEGDDLVEAVGKLLKSQAEHLDVVAKLRGTIEELEDGGKLKAANQEEEVRTKWDQQKMEWEREKEDLISQLEISRSSTTEETAKLEQELGMLKTSLGERDGQIDEALKEKQMFEKEKNKWEEDRNNIMGQLEENKTTNDVIIADLKKELETLKDSLQSKDNEIKQNQMDDFRLKNLENDLKAKENVLAETKQLLASVQNEKEDLLNVEKELRIQNKDLKESNTNLQNGLDNLQQNPIDEDAQISNEDLLMQLKLAKEEIERLKNEIENKSSAWTLLRDELTSNQLIYARERTESEAKMSVIKKQLERVNSAASCESSGAESEELDNLKKLHREELEKLKLEHKAQLDARQSEMAQLKSECDERVGQVQADALASEQKMEVLTLDLQNKIDVLQYEAENGQQFKADWESKNEEVLVMATNNRNLQEQLDVILEKVETKERVIEELKQGRAEFLSDVEIKNEQNEKLTLQLEELSNQLKEAKNKEIATADELSALNNVYVKSQEALSKKCEDVSMLETKLGQLERENKNLLQSKENLEAHLNQTGQSSSEIEKAFNKKCEEFDKLTNSHLEIQEELRQKSETATSIEAKLDQLTRDHVSLAEAKDSFEGQLSELLAEKENIAAELVELKQNYKIKENELSSALGREEIIKDELASKEAGFQFLQDQQMKLNAQLKAKDVTEQNLMSKIYELTAKVEDNKFEEEILRLTEEKNSEACLQQEKLMELNEANTELLKAKDALLEERTAQEEQLQKYKLKIASLEEAGQRLTSELDEQARILTTSRDNETDLHNAVASLKNISETLSISDQESKAEVRTLKATIDQLKAELKELAAVKKEEVEQNEKDIDESEESGIDKNMIQVLNEKIRENSLMKSECSHLMSSLAEEREEKEKLERQLEESVQTYSNMNTDAIKKLSLLVRDKDLEISSLNERYKSLLEVIQNEKHAEKEDGEKEKVSKEKFSTLENEIKRLTEENVRLVQNCDNTPDNVHSETWKNKDIVENSNELLYLKGRIAELEKKLNNVGQSRRRYLSEDLAIADGQNVMENCELVKSTDTPAKLAEQDEATARLAEEARMSARKLETKQMQIESLEQRVVGLGEELREEKDRGVAVGGQLAVARDQQAQLQLFLQEKEQEVERTRRSMVSLQSLLDEKRSSSESQQAEAMKYIAECRRLEEELGKMGRERDQALAQASTRSEEAADLRREVAGIIEKKRRVEGEVERLRGHLVAVEEGYTTDLVQGEDRERELRKRVAHLEDKVRVYTVEQTEATHDATEAVEQLKAALDAATIQRDKFSDQLSTANAHLREKNSSLRNLQLALEGFQRQKENELKQLEKNCNARVAVEQKAVRMVEEQLRTAKLQLDRANTGLEAAVRLGEQIENKNTVIANLKQEMNAREDLLKQAQEKINNFNTSNVGKVDRSLVKNIVIGYVTADNSKKLEVLRIVATVLDFNQEERARTGLDGSASSWLYGLMGSTRSRNPSTSGPPPDLDQSIAQAFVRFLENESSPRVAPTLPAVEMARNKEEQMGRNTPRRPSGSPMPLLMSPMPSLNHTPSILKSVLDERVEGDVVVGSTNSSPAPATKEEL